jgi:hypothetical protein
LRRDNREQQRKEDERGGKEIYCGKVIDAER